MLVTVIDKITVQVVQTGAQPMKNAFLDAATNVLKSWGYTQTNDVTDVRIAVPDDFNLEVGKWRWNGAGWDAYTPPPLTVAELKAQATAQLDSTKLTKALAIWTAQKLNVPLATARDEIATIYSQL